MEIGVLLNPVKPLDYTKFESSIEPENSTGLESSIESNSTELKSSIEPNSTELKSSIQPENSTGFESPIELKSSIEPENSTGLKSSIQTQDSIKPNSTRISNSEKLSDTERFCLFPIRYQEVWKMYKKQVASFWTSDEIDLSRDKTDWQRISDEERFFISRILAFFVSADGIVGENLATMFFSDTQIPEIRCFYGFQLAMENIHAETYSLLLDTLITDESEKLLLLNSIQSIDPIRKKANWTLKWIDNNSSFIERLIAFAIVEGVFFSGSFCSIFWFKKRGLFPGLSFSNELISRDESLHCEFACLLYKLISTNEIDVKKIRGIKNNTIPKQTVDQIITEAVDIEKEFIDYILPKQILDINAKLMKQYIEFVADRLLLNLGFQKIFYSENPFQWMEMISLEGKTNFFERRVSEYQKSLDKLEASDSVFDINVL
jgi:ribonucleotide reductase beta subunit family protein with ferritin-like domain